MAYALDIPRTVNTGNKGADRDIQRISHAVSSLASTVGAQAQVTQKTADVPATNGNVDASFGGMVRVSPGSSSTVYVLLPRPQPSDAGKAIMVVRRASGGTVKVSAPSADINGASSLTLGAAVGAVIILCDGEDYYTADGLV